MRSPVFHLSILAAAALLAACGSDVASPAAARPSASASQPALLIDPGEGVRTILDTVDASGNRTMVAEYPAGMIRDADGDIIAYIGSVTIRTFIPVSSSGATSRGPCITSTIETTETTPGWTASIKKPGGCDKEIEVQFENASTRQRADFSFLYIAGKTRIDFGTVR